MTRREVRDVAASVRAKLADLARARREDHQLLLMRYVTERLLARLAASDVRDRFVLKGAALFVLWADRPHRPTRDLDFLARGEADPATAVELVRRIVSTTTDPDGLTFDGDAIVAKPIREAQAYPGLRVTIPVSLGKTRLRLQVDLGFGDAVEPRPRLVDYPTLLGHASPRIKAYPREAVIAEKFEALVSLGIANSRMKDIHDLWVLATGDPLDAETLRRSIEATFRRRGTAIPRQRPTAFTEVFAHDAAKKQLWAAFLGRAGLDGPRELSDALATIEDFIMPVIGRGTPDVEG